MSFIRKDELLIIRGMLKQPMMGKLVNPPQEEPHFGQLVERIMESTENKNKVIKTLPSIELRGENGKYYGRTIVPDKSTVTLSTAKGNTSIIMRAKSKEESNQVQIYWDTNILYDFVNYLMEFAEISGVKVDTPYPYAYSEEISVSEKGIERSIFLTPQYIRFERFGEENTNDLWTRINRNQVNAVLKVATSYFFNHNEFDKSLLVGNVKLEQLYEDWSKMKGVK